MIKQDISENQARIAYLAIGSNLGKRINNIERAKFLLISNGIRIVETSSYYETLSWPDKSKPKFLNIVVQVKVISSPNKLIKILKKIEKQLGRKKNTKNSPRECDIDIIDYDGKISSGTLIIPHERMHNRNFVLFPLYEIDKNWIHPKFRISIKKLIISLSIKDIRSIKQI